MNTKQFLKKKNKIVKKVTGHTLIPKDQIKNTPKVYLNETHSLLDLSSDICPYCSIYNYSCKTKDGKECPMLEENNKCENNRYEDDKETTWYISNQAWISKATDKDKEKLRKLIKEYNKGTL